MTEPPPNIKLLAEKATDLIRQGKYKDVISMADKENMSPSERFLISTTIAKIASQIGHKSIAYSIYKNTHDDLIAPEKLGPNHKDVIDLKHAMASTTTSVQEAHKLLVMAIKRSDDNGYADLTKSLNKSLDTVMESLPKQRRRMVSRMYEKIGNESRRPKDIVEKQVKEPVVNKPLSKDEIGGLMTEFGLSD